MATQIVLAVTLTASISLIIAGILFYLFYRFIISRRLEKSKLDSSFRREVETPAPRIEFRQHGRAIKGVIVDEEGLDVLYLRNLEGRQMSRCFSKVWYNPMDEVVKRMNSREEKPSNSNSISHEPIQEIPLLQEPIINIYELAHHHHELKKPLPNLNQTPLPTPNSRLATKFTPPSPPPTPPQTPPPPPPPPPPRPSPPPPPPGPPKLRPAPPPLPAKMRGVVSSNKPPMPPRGSENRHVRTKDSNEESMRENEVRTKLKPLHWDKVTANADHSMVWNEINDGSFRFDDELMETLFGYTSTSQKSTTAKTNNSSYQKSSNSAQSAQIFLLDPRKSQNTAIVLKSLAISRLQILDALIDGRGLNADILEKLTRICPTQDEITKILHFNGDPSKLADAESFLHHILKAVPSAFIRFNAMLFRTTYDPEILHLKESLQTLELGCKELRTGRIFFKLLEAILKAGNRLNAGTNRGNAQGFNLTTLRRLSDVKSTDGKTTLLHFVVEQVVRSEGKRCMINTNHSRSKNGEPNSDIKISNVEKDNQHVKLGLEVLESLNTDFANMKKAASLDYDSLIAMCPILTTRVDEIKNMLKNSKDIESGGFLKEMKGFLEDCEEELNVVVII